VFFAELLVEAEEVAEAPPHCKRLAAEHGQRGLKRADFSFFFQAFVMKTNSHI